MFTAMYNKVPFNNILRNRILVKYYIIMSTKAMSIDQTWRGVQLSQIYGSDSPWGSPEFPLVRPGFNHAVLYHIPSHGDLERPPKPQIGHDKWDHDHVRMPYSQHSLYPIVDENGQKQLKERWLIIEEALSKPIRNSKELAAAILKYNTQFIDVWKFSSLHYLLNEHLEEEESNYFFDVTLPQIAKLALALPKLIQSSIPLLKQEKNKSISLTQHQVSSLLANAFFCTFPRRNSRKSTAEYCNYPYINFSNLYNIMPKDSILEKLKCICHYFRRVCTKVPTGVVTFTRRFVPRRDCPDWGRSESPIANVPLYVDSETIIEDMHGLIQVDFANKFLGGGVLGGGCVQEEIRFVICPELILSMLFTEVLKPTETLFIIGSERYSNYTGYGSSFQWAGNHVDQTPYDSSCRRRCAVLAMDARPYFNPSLEWKKEAILRELNKAWVGFSTYTDDSPTIQYPGIATGNWGCGAFGGTATLKWLLQLASATHARRGLAYCTFGDSELRDHVGAVYGMLAGRGVTVGQLFNMIVKYCETCNVKETTLRSFLEKELGEGPSPHHMSVDNSQATVERDKKQQETVEENKKDEENLFESFEFDGEISPDLFEDDEPNVVETSKSSDPKKLFTELDKQDEASGNLNLNGPRCSTETMDVEVSPKVKKIMTKKITDYFKKT
ncbi:poly(ADP-ribose) glycohydrolase isoform X1 [Colias croceus]|uniref:poly(ADP-ribose) glycohydrolase isoform X1 n=3 Tax=Colias crocea TaxID=72248 RepID=UPI001E27CF69|nr:poly(ADP-ribose) glycohydrolase isoform X1 [Colias croceus]